MIKSVRYRPIKKLGCSYAIHLRTEDMIDFKIKLGDFVDISDCIVISKELYDVKFKEKNLGKKNEK